MRTTDVSRRFGLLTFRVRQTSALMPDAAPLQVLVAEDSRDDVLLLQRAFRKAGSSAQLHPVPDGLAALAYLRGESPYSDRARHPFPDLLLLDLNMPRLNGFEVLAAVRADPGLRQLAVYVLTASNLPADVERAHELHTHGYIVKPNRVDELVTLASAVSAWQRITLWPRIGAAPAS